MENKKFVELIDISKSFPGVKALNKVNLTFNKGEVHGIVGENGAGKSTLIKILTGVYQKDSGAIHINGEEKKIESTIDAHKNKLWAVYQETIIAPELSIGENFFLGKLPINKMGIIDWNQVFNKSDEILSKYSIEIDTRKKIADLSNYEKAFITIIKVIQENAELIIFDEPTAKLTAEEVKQLFKIIKDLKKSGVAVVYISHNLKEIFEICDIVTVLRDGEKVITLPTVQSDEKKLTSLMVGRTFESMYQIQHFRKDKEVLKVEDLSRSGSFRNVSFTLHVGEVLGFYGLVGSGRTALMRALFGAEKPDTGKVIIYDNEVEIKEPYDAINHGIGMVPEDRRGQGLALPLNIESNINVTSYEEVSHFGVINNREAVKRAQKLVKSLAIKTPSIFQQVSKLSGGTQQKVILARWLSKNSNILILDEPTIGIDVGAKSEIYHLIQEMSEQGKSIILISSYLPEIIGLSDKVFVMVNGEIVKELSGKDMNEEQIIRSATDM